MDHLLGSSQHGTEVALPGLISGLTKGETAQEDHLSLNKGAPFQPTYEFLSPGCKLESLEASFLNMPRAQVVLQSNSIRLLERKVCTSFLWKHSMCFFHDA